MDESSDNEETAISSLRGREVAITGRLFALSRAEAIARLVAVQARYVARVSERTAVLVVGQAGPPLGRDGRLTASLRRALALQESGSELRIVSEETLLDLLSLGEERAKLWSELIAYLRDEVVADVLLFHMVSFARVGDRIEFQPTIATNSMIELADISFK